MKFRPCIDIQNGKVKQIVGGSLMDTGNRATENFVAQQTAAYFAGLYQSKKLVGGHIILLNPVSSEFYEQTKHQAMEALKTYPGGLQIGGGITPENAGEYLEAGASHVIVTSYVFKDGVLHYERLRKMSVEQRMEQMELNANRADVIVPALFIFTTVLCATGTDTVVVPKLGLVDGIVRELYKERKVFL